MSPRSTALAVVDAREEMTSPGDFGAEHMRIVREAFAPTASQAEFEVMWAGAKSRGLDPVKKQIHFVKRFDSMRGGDVWSSQVSIDGFRSLAESTGLYDGQDEPDFEYDEQKRLILARVRVYRKDISRPFVGTARWSEYVQTKKGGEPSHMWAKMEHTMLAKCAEALALRKAFPERLGGLYTGDEMAQAENVTAAVVHPEPRQLPPAETLETQLERAVAEAVEAGKVGDRERGKAAVGDLKAWCLSHGVAPHRWEEALTSLKERVAAALPKPAELPLQKAALHVTVDGNDPPDAIAKGFAQMREQGAAIRAGQAQANAPPDGDALLAAIRAAESPAVAVAALDHARRVLPDLANVFESTFVDWLEQARFDVDELAGAAASAKLFGIAKANARKAIEARRVTA